ncbi:phosphatidylserine decarboxylase-domain-containing protein [Cantharellus anzutake]|uniref:phosphatidylserine decarboxylase-domain-containing protein n=1 Tax=Cantharellus anzutake TaxID=1750568 RepID=UPI001904561D|nr:phosphatidylserine decarboxylase-domain-containing protein [Cantharellus anzutake]KAF8334013.1 phosphatidylserine decarboxylase-domain-containing protein [Cantharellus anzutake]
MSSNPSMQARRITAIISFDTEPMLCTHRIDPSCVVDELRDYLCNNPEARDAFDLGVKIAIDMNIPQLKKFNIYDLEGYFEFCESFLHWVPTETFDGKNTPILPTSRSPYTWLSQWIIRFAKAMGSNLDKPESLTPESLETFRNSPIYHTTCPWTPRRPQCHHREQQYRLPQAHPLAYPPIVGRQPLQIQVRRWCFHSFLAPYDYHRLHAPVAGEVIKARVIPGLCYLEVDATTDGDRNACLSMKRALPAARSGPGAPKGPGGVIHTGSDILAPNTPGYQFLQARGLIVIKDPDTGLVAVLPIGMCQVSSVVLTVKDGDTLKKGDEISYFQCGYVMLFQRKANVGFTTSHGQHYNVGIQVARAFPDGIPQEGFKPAPKCHKHIKRPESALPNGH